MRHRGIGCLFLFFLVVGMGATARGQKDPPSARELSDQGLAAFNQGRYAEAIRAFLASYEISPLPALMFNVAQAHRLLGDCQQAEIYYRRYLNELPEAS